MTAEEGLKDFCIVVSTKVAGAACQLAHSLLSQNRAPQPSAPRILGNLGAILGGIAHDLKIGIRQDKVSQSTGFTNS
ncbi:unnamed protein product [Aureobasidium vineae]|uniref:Uncharacterized protein n=1 Tax=Aureobasidium vineae TaxID=2773715 RepID=A0A9N8JAH3_9PEZI|nr:unnamed protein product [Aureobasidium vineae]